MKNSAKQLLPIFTMAIILLFATQSCNKESDPVVPVTHERGEIINSKSIGMYTPADIQQILDAAQVQLPFTLSNSVEVLSVTYYTIDAFGNEIITSGAICIPQGTNNLPLMSIQHGTQTKRNLVASVSPNNSTEGVISLITSSMGYFTVVPDYPGFGASTSMHPYTHANSLVPCVVDFIRAGKSYVSEKNMVLDGRVFLTGYSEGGYVTLAAQKTIEQEFPNEFNLTAVAPLDGPYDLKGMAETIFKDLSYSTPAYVAYLLTAYNEIYGWNRLGSFFKEPYAAAMPGLFNGSKTWGEIVNQLPETIPELLQPDFIKDLNDGKETDLMASIQENTLLDWTPKTPIHFFHGDADELVPYQNALTAMEAFTANGAESLQLTTIPGGTHDTSGPLAIVGAIQWFETL